MKASVKGTPLRLLIAAVVLFACGDPTDPDDNSVARIILDRSTLSFSNIGLVDTLHAKAVTSSGAEVSGVVFTWTTSDASVATVTNGVVTTVGLGSAQITATASGMSASAAISVPIRAATITLDKPQMTFAHVGLRDTVRATLKDQLGRVMTSPSVTWSSSSSTIASVDAAGAVTSLGVGGATLTASASEVQATIQVTVAPTSPEWALCSGGTPVVMLLVEAQYRFPISAALTRYANDLCAEGYTVWLAESVPANPPAIRSYLADARSRSNKPLVGVMLVGNIPHAYQYVVAHSANPNIPDTKEEAISFQYYSDLDGGFSTSAGFSPTHPFSYDVHDGDVNWEIWVGVLPVYKGSPTATTTALLRYFDKNHAYRTGGPKPPRIFVNVSEFFTATSNAEYAVNMEYMKTGIYSWKPFSTADGSQFFFNSTTPALTVQQGYTALQNGVGDFFVAESHGFAGAAGLLTIATVESNPVKTIFFWSSGCSIGDLDKADNFLTSVVYSSTSLVLVGKGTTNSSGGMGNNSDGYYGRNIATALTAGASFGAAMQAHANVPLVFPYNLSREFHLGTPVVVGDPTLKIRP